MLADLVVATLQFAKANQSLALLVLTFLLIVYKLVLYPFFISPLRHIPGPYLHRISHIPSYEAQRKHQWVEIVHNLHAKYGNVVILSPTSVACNGDPKYINDIYVKNMPKHKFYENFRNHGFKDNIFASLENDRHLKYKRLVQNLYSKSSVFNPKNSTRQNVVEKVGDLVQLVYKSSVTGEEPDYRNARLALNEYGKGHQLGSGDWFNKKNKKSFLGIDVYSLFGSLAMDVVSAFELGIENGTDLLKNPEKRDILVPHRMQAGMVFWTTLMPRFWDWAAGPAIREASRQIEEWQLNLYAKAEENVPKPKVGENLSTLETFKKNGFRGKYAYSFLSDNIFAGHETTAIQLTYMCYELSRPVNKARQALLRKELQDAFGVAKLVDHIIDDLEAVDKLPYLEALIQENSRVHTSIPGSEPRVTDKPYVVNVGGKKVELPVGTQISCQPYSMHRVEFVFEDADLWIPERWLRKESESESEYKDRMTNMQRYMMPFGKGIRMCLGMNLAVIEMKLALANLYWKFSSDICRDWCDVIDADGKVGNKIQIGSQYMTSNSDESMMTMVDAYTTRPYFDECWLEWLDA